jgi:MtfA peptidase
LNIPLILEKYFGYYRKLGPEHKKEFQRRVENFITQKEFVPRAELPVVTEEMKVIASSSAIQLTFGLRETYFDHFKVLLFYPDEFLSNYSLSYQKGEVHPDGYLVFSWKHLALGNLLPDKSENIGLQLFARALGIQNNTEGTDYDLLKPFHLHHWKKIADQEFEKLVAAGQLFYGKKIEREDFFPVAAEYFFEDPGSFKKENLTLYNALSSLLNQHP